VDAGALPSTLESAWLAAAAGERPVAVIPAISDIPAAPLVSPAALAGSCARWPLPAGRRARPP